MNQNLEAARGEPVNHLMTEQQVLEDPAGQGYDGQPVLVAQQRATFLDDSRDPVMEPGRDDGTVRPGREVVSHCLHQVGPGDLQRRPGPDPGPVTAALGGVGQLLELDRRLPFVVDGIADADDRGDRVEQAPGTGRQRGVNPSPRQLDDGVPVRLVAPRHVQLPRMLPGHGTGPAASK